MLNTDQLISIKEYIESREKIIDGEKGECRELPDLIKDGEMPEIYFIILKEIESGH